MLKKRNRISLLLTLITLQCFSQQFRNTATLPVVTADSFYSIPITPELSSYLKTDLSDIRIADEKGQWVPHMISPGDFNLLEDQDYSKLSIKQQESNKEKTTVILENVENRSFSTLYVRIKNSSSIRKALISGCDDARNWFAITDTFTLLKQLVISSNTMLFELSFPSINYRYIKFSILNNGNDPFNIIEAFHHTPHKFFPLEYLNNPSLSFVQYDTTGYTLVKVDNPKRIHYSRFTVNINHPKYYNRRIKFYSSNEIKSFNELKRTTSHNEFIFSSGNLIDYDTPLLKDSFFYILVENNDNPPLQFTGIETKQPSRELRAFLEKGKKYKLLFNDSAAKAPVYDLKNFKESHAPNLQKLKYGPIESINKTNEIIQQKQDFKKWLWPTIIVILALLSYFTFTLSKDIKKRNNNS